MRDDLRQRLRDDETVQELETLLWEQAEKVDWQPAKAILAYVCDCLNGKVPVEEIAAGINTVVAGHRVPQPGVPTRITLFNEPFSHHAGSDPKEETCGPKAESIIEKLQYGELPRSIILKGDAQWIG